MRVLTIADTHFPYHHPRFFKHLKAAIATHKPDYIVHLGDLVDFHAFSRYEHSPELPGGKGEVELARRSVREMVDIVGSIPVYICEGNHEARFRSALSKAGIPSSFAKSWPEILSLPATWKVAPSHCLDNILYTHRASPVRGRALIAGNYVGIISGHCHSKHQITYSRGLNSGSRFEMVVGGCCNDESPAMAYAVNGALKTITGYGVVDNRVPGLYTFE